MDRPSIIGRVCHLAATAAVEFAGKGHLEMEGGFRTWQELDLPVER
jgi:hypothetical protein